MDLYDCTKYITNKQNIKHTIEKYGVAIIPNILNEEECIEMQNEMWNYLEHLTQKWSISIDRLNDETWYQIKYLIGNNIIFNFWNIGHSQMAWNVRQNPKIVNIFAKFYNVYPDELVASFDASSIYFPPEITESEWYENVDDWYHTDQSFVNNKFSNLQSWVTAYDVEEGDATLSFFESSHLFHKIVAEEFNIQNTSNFYRLNNKELEFYKNYCLEKRIICPRGSLVLWDSRTIHFGMNPSQNRKNPKIRCISYLCYAPKINIDIDSIDKRIDAFNNLKTSNHDPINITFKPILTEKDFKECKITRINTPIISKLGLKLIGF
jgi:ectoine hydroxylase-related dioxygenase (phytanoyl-CoA dioxygenase family)